MLVGGRSIAVCGFLWTGYLATTVSLLAQDTDLRAPMVPTATTASVSNTDPKRDSRQTQPNNRPLVWRRLHVPDPNRKNRQTVTFWIDRSHIQLERLHPRRPEA